MTVGELREILEDMDDDAQVFIMAQSHWPFEHDVQGAVQRCELYAEDGDEDCAGPDEDEMGDLRPSDVFLVEGTQLRYGSKSAWNCG
jgi:hypothetical protein